MSQTTDPGRFPRIRREQVTVDFSDWSHARRGWVEYWTRGDTVVLRQSLNRTEQWETDAVQEVYIPRRILRYIAGDPAVRVEDE
jgi:hypothetical protein